jgi:hypothetical protein
VPDKPYYGVYDTVALSRIRALAFDTFGTVVDWRSSLIFELSRPCEYGPRQQSDFVAEKAWTVVASDLRDLASLVLT